MSNKEKRSNLPECGCRRCNLKVNRPTKNCTKLDEAADKRSLRTRVHTGLQCSTVECSCDRNKQYLSNLSGNRGTFIRFAGPTSKSSVNPAEYVVPTNSKIRSTYGCFIEKSSDGKSRAFDLESNDVSEEAPNKHFRSVTIWQGVLNKPLCVRTRRSSGLVTLQADRSLSSDHNFCTGKSQAERKRLCKKTFHFRLEVGTQDIIKILQPRYFRLEVFSYFSSDAVDGFESWSLNIENQFGIVCLVSTLCRFDLEICWLKLPY